MAMPGAVIIRPSTEAISIQAVVPVSSAGGDSKAKAEGVSSSKAAAVISLVVIGFICLNRSLN